MKQYIIGIDGGGTKTAFVIAEYYGSELIPLAELTLDRSNPADVGTNKTLSVLESGIRGICAEAGIDIRDVGAAFAGIAGVCSNDGYINIIEDFLASLLPNALTAVGSDGLNPLYAAFPESDGVGVICGTGSSCFVKKGASIIRIGGYGPFDGLGNGYEIGKAAVNHALRALDGRDSASPLSDAVLKKHCGDLIAHLGDLIAEGKREIASYAKTAYDNYYCDEYARKIIQDNMRYVAELIDAAAGYFDGEYNVKITGSVGCNDISFGLITSFCNKNAAVSRLTEKPVTGAAVRAKMLLT